MALRKIVEQGDPVLNKTSRRVTDFNRRLHLLIDDMIETLENANGAGLAAPQVGVLRRVCIVLNEEAGNFYELVNPEIVSKEGDEEGLEGCLSVPGKWGLVRRPTAVRVRAQDRDGNWFEVEGTGLAARAFCHELEHLDGHLYTEHIDRFLTDQEVEAYLEENGEGKAGEESHGRRGNRRKDAAGQDGPARREMDSAPVGKEEAAS